jgi:hypothetical protein
MRTGWRIIGMGFAASGALNALLLVGFSLWELSSPESVDSAGVSPWLVLPPWIVVCFLVARWALRRSSKTPPNPLEQRAADTTRRLNGWAAAHPVRMATISGAIIGGFWSLTAGWREGVAIGLVFAAIKWLGDRVRRRRQFGALGSTPPDPA